MFDSFEMAIALSEKTNPRWPRAKRDLEVVRNKTILGVEVHDDEMRLFLEENYSLRIFDKNRSAEWAIEPVDSMTRGVVMLTDDVVTIHNDLAPYPSCSITDRKQFAHSLLGHTIIFLSATFTGFFLTIDGHTEYSFSYLTERKTGKRILDYSES